MDFNNSNSDSWAFEECFDDYDEMDIYNNKPPSEDTGFTIDNKQESFSEEDILKTYALSYIGCDEIEEG